MYVFACAHVRARVCILVEKFARAGDAGVTRKFAIIKSDVENFVRARPLKVPAREVWGGRARLSQNK